MMNFNGLRSSDGFTLAEMMLVIFIVILLTATAITGMIRSQKSFLFNTADQQIQSLMREARSLAVTGKAQPDYTDFDGDGCKDAGKHDRSKCTVAMMADTESDYVTPANYGVYFDADLNPNKITLFADIHEDGIVALEDGSFDDPPAGTPIGTYVAGFDVVLDEYVLPDSLKLIIDPVNGAEGYGVLYSPIFADVSFDNRGEALPAPLFKYGLKEVNGDRTRCMLIHPIAGVPEAMDKADSSATCS